jgi:Tfp pilus assembly protein PilX
MLNANRNIKHAQQGVIMIVAMLVLVAVTIAAIALTRSVDTATLVAGNLAFKKAATRASDKGIEAAIAALQALKTSGALDADDPTNGYYASLNGTDIPTTSWPALWNSKYKDAAVALPVDQFGNTVSFVINRVCATSGSSSGGQCVASNSTQTATGNAEESGPTLQSSSQIYYRITVRVAGPRNTESYVQSHIAM